MKFKDLILILSIFGIALIAYFAKDSIGFKSNLQKSDYKEEEEVIAQNIPILLYHYVDDISNKEDGKYLLNTRPEVLEAQIVTLKKAGYKFIKMKDIPEILEKRNSNKYIVLTFDDGYNDFYFYVFPLLKKYNVPAVNYIMPQFIGSELYLNESQIQELVKSNLVEIGSHTLSHASLTSLVLADANIEIIQSKKVLEERFGIEVTSFAYPYGRFNEDLVKLVEAAGYTNATTTEEGSIVVSNKLYEIPRIRPGINSGDDLLYVIEEYYK